MEVKTSDPRARAPNQGCKARLPAPGWFFPYGWLGKMGLLLPRPRLIKLKRIAGAILPWQEITAVH